MHTAILGVGWISHGRRPLTNTDTSEGQSGGREGTVISVGGERLGHMFNT